MPVTQRTIILPFGLRIVQYTDAETLRQNMQIIIKRLREPKPFLMSVANIMRADLRRQFAVGGDPKWKPLSPYTIRRKARMGFPALTVKGNIPRRLVQNGQFGPSNIEIQTGALRDAWSTTNSPNHFERIDTTDVTIKMGPRTDKLRYARIQQLGGTVRGFGGKRVTIPARPVRVTAPCVREIIRTARDYYKIGEINGSIRNSS